MTDYFHKYIKYKTKYLELKNTENQIGGKNTNIHLEKSDIIDDDNLKIIKTLGTGMLGTTYLVVHNGKKYALKVQHILEEERNKDFNNEMWRELDLYNYITKLSDEEQLFFTKLYEYKIYNDCTHVQERPFKINLNDAKNPFIQRLKKLDESNWCVKFLLDYKGNTNLDTFLYQNNPKPQLIYSLCLQICKINLVLKKGGYSHNDLHPGNIMINKTDKKYFNFMNKKIPYQGYQLSAIDYGEVLHKKFNIKYKGWKKTFILNPEKWYFDEIFYNTMNILDGISRNINDCKKNNKIMPFERKVNMHNILIKKIITKHPDFYKLVRVKYVKQFPKGEKLLDYFISKIHLDKSIYDIVKNKNQENFWDIINRIVYEFQIFFPKEYSLYYKWCSFYDSILPKDIMQEILLINNTEDYINYFIDKIEDFNK